MIEKLGWFVEGTLNYIIFFWKCARMKNKKVITKNLEVDELYRMSTTRALKNVSLKRYLRLKFQDNTTSGFSLSRIPWDWLGIFAKSIPWVWLRIFVNSTQGFWLQICNHENPEILTSNLQQFPRHHHYKGKPSPRVQGFFDLLSKEFSFNFPQKQLLCGMTSTLPWSH